MKKKIYIHYILLVGLLYFNSCQLDEIEDPNNPSITLVSKNATKGQLQTLITGLEATSKGYLSTTANALGTFGRDIWYFNYNDGRNVQYWTGQGGRVPDADFYGVGSIYTSPYQTIKQANTLINAVNNTEAVNAQEKLAYLGFAKTIEGYQYLVPATTQYKNGIRIDVSNESKPGPFVSYEEALKAIRDVLDEGYKNLTDAGNVTLPFSLTKGYAGFATPAGLAKVNRALAARVAIYQKDWKGALDALKLSFFDLEGNLKTGPAHVYGAPPESYNPFYYVLGADLRTLPVVHPLFVEEAIPGDKRITEKIFVRTTEIINTVGSVPLASKYQDKRWATNSDPIAYIRNEELILIYAEASVHQKSYSDAVDAIDVIRLAAGIGKYTGPKTEKELIDEILLQRRYSLWFEPGGHRWIDLRRYDRLNEISTALDEGSVFTQLARPTSEVNWDEYVNNNK